MKKLLIMFGKTLGLASAITLFAAMSSANAVELAGRLALLWAPP